MNNVFDCSKVAEELLTDMKQSIKGCIIRPSLAVIEIGENETNNYKVKYLEDACNKIGVYFRHFKFEDDTPELTIINKIKELNNDDYVNGVMVELPIPEKYNDKRIINTIINSKDICGITDINIGRFISGRKTITAPASLALVELFSRINLEIEKKNIVVIGKGRMVGMPIITTLLNNGATVTVCHSKTDDIKKYIKDKDILITTTGVPKLITKDMLDENTIIIDLGYSIEKGKITGDIENNLRKERKDLIYGANEGIWELVIAMYLKNLIVCYNSKKANN